MDGMIIMDEKLSVLCVYVCVYVCIINDNDNRWVESYKVSFCL